MPIGVNVHKYHSGGLNKMTNIHLIFYSFFPIIIAFSLNCYSKPIPSDVGCLFQITQTEPEESYGYINGKGDIVIPLGKYPMCYTDTFCTFAVVLKKGNGFVGIDRNERVLFKVFPYDNGPDYLSDGLMRIVKDGQIGFADSVGNIVIAPQFTAVMPFRNGLAAYCPDCVSNKAGEHSSWIGGKWGFVNKSGHTVIKPNFERIVQPFNTDTAVVIRNGKQIVIDRKGNERK